MMNPRRLVIIESPYAGKIKANTRYAIDCCNVAINLGLAPFASHLFYPQMLNERIVSERQLGITLGLAIGSRADEVWMCHPSNMSDWTPGMKHAFSHYLKLNKTIFDVVIEPGGALKTRTQIWPKEKENAG